MWKHLKDNHGIHPIWPAIIIAIVTVLIFGVGLIMIYQDHPALSGISSSWNEFTVWLKNIFNFGPHRPLQ